MFAQYLAIKQEHEDALLFYRMGDFYELFFDDAITASRALQIALTSRNSQAENPIPMCGVPYHSAEGYINQLLGRGFKVAICEQMEDPKSAKGLVKRSVTRVRTIGTSVEDATLGAKEHNYLGAVFWNAEKGNGGFAWMDFSTGEWSGLFSRKETELWQWVQKMQPRELLVPDLPNAAFSLPRSVSLGNSTPVRLPLSGYFELTAAADRILRVQGVKELGAVGLNEKEELTRACGALLGYLLQTQKQELAHLKPFVPLNLSRHLIIDEISERNLEIFRCLDGKKGPGTLWQILDETITPMGGRLLEERLRHPWRSLPPIRESADAVQFFFDREHTRVLLRKALDAVHDLERLATRIALGRAAPKDFLSLGRSLDALKDVRSSLESLPPRQHAQDPKEEIFPDAVHTLRLRWDDLADLAGLLRTALAESPPPLITEGGLFKPGYNRELDELLDLVEHGEAHLQELLQREQQANTLPRLKLGFNRVFGYYFELPKSLAQEAPAHFSRRQTLANAERFITPALKELEDKILAAGESRKRLEYKLFQELRETVNKERARILFMAEALAALDFWQGLAETARKRDWTRPEVHEDFNIVIRAGRHPVVEAMSNPAGFVPNDLHLDSKRRLLLITGPNMAGKSTVLRQTAIIAILAQMGSFVPASSARIGMVDRIFSRVGASDNLARGQSTFMVEMMEAARILRQATKRSLVILDEIGRGTSTFDGLSLAWAMAEDLTRRADSSIRTLFATHYHELTALEGRLAGVHNMNIAIREWGGEIVFLRRLVPGPSDRSYGIEVAKLAGVPTPVVQRARSILEILESSRGLGSRRDSTQAVRQLLPGLPEPTTKNNAQQDKKILQASIATPPPHPFFTVLRDLDADNLTPMQALNLVTEWKKLWGKEL